VLFRLKYDVVHTLLALSVMISLSLSLSLSLSVCVFCHSVITNFLLVCFMTFDSVLNMWTVCVYFRW